MTAIYKVDTANTLLLSRLELLLLYSPISHDVFLVLPMFLTFCWVTGMVMVDGSATEDNCWDNYSDSPTIYIIVVPMTLTLLVTYFTTLLHFLHRNFYLHYLFLKVERGCSYIS